MSTKTTTAAASPAPSTATSGKPDVAGLLARIAELTAETLEHPQVIDKTDSGVASRVARFLNKEKVYICASHRFWTGAHVLAYAKKNS